MPNPKPFHQTIVTEVNNLLTSRRVCCPVRQSSLCARLEALAELTLKTAIPKNHRQVAAAFARQAKRFELGNEEIIPAVLRHIVAEKQRHLKSASKRVR